MNKIFEYLEGLGLCSSADLEEEWPRVRNADDVAVMKCKKSGVIFLDKILSSGAEDFENKSGYGFYGRIDREQMEKQYHFDNIQRRERYGRFVQNRDWVDVGAGSGGTLNSLSDLAKQSIAIEPKITAREELEKQGYKVYKNIHETEKECVSSFDIASLIQVLCYMDDPVDELEGVKKLLRPGGKIIIEVPHAKDALLEFFDLDDFRNFTFHSELLILHTRESLYKTVEAAGFQNILIEGVQRYPLANHLYWLTKGKPGGHEEWALFNSYNLDNSYSERLKALDLTDTLVVYAQA